MLCSQFPELARVPWQKTGLPADAPEWRVRAQLAYRRFRRGIAKASSGRLPARNTGFVDYRTWFREDLRPLVEETLLGEGARSGDLIRRGEVANVVQEHMHGRRDHTQLLGKLVALELWHRLFVERGTSSNN
jgi:hypothetical protein